ncbi:hypothetical protein LO749_16775 [Paracoccus denitrificans]|uniref:hypothetical protein n=1 Tax=Paracoccus denitrificans TaxID=266 RepID=UPI001E551453|nr:hypothetical protein [Paracoccus denitrificans]UFS67745.1 hypothetical protein LO749_16775 [Paracoccus denitrificans]
MADTRPLWMLVREAFEVTEHYAPEPPLRDKLVGIALDYADAKNAAARAEVERLTKERDEATATVELVNSNNLTLAAELAGWKQAARQMEAERDEARAALEAYGREKVREGMRWAAEIIRGCCPECQGTGVRDSGGAQPWGEPITVPCDCADAILAGMETIV